MKGAVLLPDTIVYQIKSSVCNLGNLFCVLWSLGSHRPLNITGYYHYSWLTSRIVSKSLGLKATHSKVLCILLEENGNHQYHPAVSPAIYNNECSAKIYRGCNSGMDVMGVTGNFLITCKACAPRPDSHLVLLTELKIL